MPLYQTVGQSRMLHSVYQTLFNELEPNRRLYLAVAQTVYETILVDRFGQLIVNEKARQGKAGKRENLKGIDLMSNLF
jgi:hypothetical protein